MGTNEASRRMTQSGHSSNFQPVSHSLSCKFGAKVEIHDYELYLGLNDIEHAETKARHPRTNEICERFHKTILQEFYQPAFRRKLYSSLEGLQNDLDAWLEHYNN